MAEPGGLNGGYLRFGAESDRSRPDPKSAMDQYCFTPLFLTIVYRAQK